ncbi:MAG TPA: RIP metalloprotease RseP [Frateuria sp.]|uniref:RIP metalloprotease RseP n=1 Tax=Frateuria sp. TaxID=2211372 RepID=UPI002DEAA5D6|nr:RIP metalloprotease RseP [Frateuria sp.]
MNPFFGSVFWLLVTLGVLVTFHEFGHYWVARRCGVKVLRFSVGFGRAVWRRIGRDGTEYQVAMIPLGGYVKMLDAREGEVDPALREVEFTSKSVWKRIAIVVAGPGFNLVFAVAALWLMFMLGRPDAAPVVTATPGSMAAQAGIQAGDRLLRVDGEPVTTMSDAMDDVATALLGREPLPLVVRGRDGRQRDVVLPLQELPAGRSIDQYFDSLGLKLGPLPAIAGQVMPDQPAGRAGMRVGDVLVAVNGTPLADFEAFAKAVKEAAPKSPQLDITVRRDGQLLHLPVLARWESLEGSPKQWSVGVGAERAVRRYGPARALRAALQATWDSTRQTFTMIGKMVSGQASTRNLSGVIGIAQVANQSAQMGLPWFLNFLALVSLSLAILNLLPIPVLDGGHLLYYLIELVKGSPVSERTQMIGQYIGLVLLFTLMGLAFYNDIHRTLLS